MRRPDNPSRVCEALNARSIDFGSLIGSSHRRGRKDDYRSFDRVDVSIRVNPIEEVDEGPVETISGFSIGSSKASGRPRS